MIVIRYIKSELQSIPRLARISYSGIVLSFRRGKRSRQNEHARQLLKQMANEGRVCSRIPFAPQNWHLFKKHQSF